MSQFRSIKGTHDILPSEVQIWQMIENNIHKLMKNYAYKEIRTPIFENTDLFIRGIGTDTDIVNKEMYSWIDQGGKSLTLKPELTAPVIRAYVQNQLDKQSPIHRLYYFDTLFRRERPQKGRQRQFYQFGVEAVGSPYPEQDSEVIALAYRIYEFFGIKDMQVKINSIGSSDIRPAYLDLLRSSIKKYIDDLCNTCKGRLKKNALRLFDCKNSECKEILTNKAPIIFDYISEEDHEHFNEVKKRLDLMKIPYVHDNSLVRGLDFYTQTTFEIISSSLGAQDALCGGGRYNDLVKQIGGKATPAVGFAAGVERLILAMDKSEHIDISIDIYLITIGNKANIFASNIAQEIRKYTNKSIMLETLRRSLKSQMREANRCNAKYVIIIGEDELMNEVVVVKNMQSSEQVEISNSNIINYFKSNS